MLNINHLARHGVARQDWQRTLESRPLKRIAVLGANGTMGATTGALFATVAQHVTFLARTRAKAEAGMKAAGARFRSSALAARIDLGDYEHDLEHTIENADLVFEAVSENFALKRSFLERVDACRRQDAVVATVSSGLSINRLADGLSDSFRRHFLGLHFFNPPNVIVGTEIIANRDTDPVLIDLIELFVSKRLGRVTVRTQDTPGFAGNRVGFKVLNEAAQLAEQYGADLVDQLLGPYTGRVLPPLRTIDLVGWDIHAAIVDNLYENTNDEAHEMLLLPDYMRRLIAKGLLGDKGGGGFFKQCAGGQRSTLNLRSGEYATTPSTVHPELAFVGTVASLHRAGRYREAMQAFARAQGEFADIARRLVLGYVSYAYARVGEVVERVSDMDTIMSAGFNWAPPSALVYLVGKGKIIQLLDQMALEVPRALERETEDSIGRWRNTNHFGRFFIAS